MNKQSRKQKHNVLSFIINLINSVQVNLKLNDYHDNHYFCAKTYWNGLLKYIIVVWKYILWFSPCMKVYKIKSQLHNLNLFGSWEISLGLELPSRK